MPPPRFWRAASFALAALFALAIAGDLLWMPVQVDDALGEILDAQHTSSIGAAFVGSIGTDAYLRPARIAQIKALFDIASRLRASRFGAERDAYWLVYRGFHALLLVAAVLLFAALLDVSTAVDFAAAAVALTVLVGLHTFRGTIQEAFPINHFLEIVVGTLIVVNLARSRPAHWKDAVAVLTLAAAVLTLESGLLLWVAVVTAWAIGWRGISIRGVAVMTIVVAAYIYLRFFYLATGVPTLAERSSGYLFGMLDPPELQARFGAHPLWFYAYNVTSSVLSVLFSEPRAGVFAATDALMKGGLPLRLSLWLVTSSAMTALIVWSAARRMRAGSVDDGGRMLVLFVMMLVANAALSFAYTKDEIISVAGVFYACAAFVAIGDVLDVRRVRARGIVSRAKPALRKSNEGRAEPVLRNSFATAALLTLLVALASAWATRAIGVHYLLRSQALKHQNDWAVLPHKWQREGRWPADAAAQHLIFELRHEAVGMWLPNTRYGDPDWPGRLWID